MTRCNCHHHSLSTTTTTTSASPPHPPSCSSSASCRCLRQALNNPDRNKEDGEAEEEPQLRKKSVARRKSVMAPPPDGGPPKPRARRGSVCCGESGAQSTPSSFRRPSHFKEPGDDDNDEIDATSDVARLRNARKGRRGTAAGRSMERDAERATKLAQLNRRTSADGGDKSPERDESPSGSPVPPSAMSRRNTGRRRASVFAGDVKKVGMGAASGGGDGKEGEESSPGKTRKSSVTLKAPTVDVAVQSDASSLATAEAATQAAAEDRLSLGLVAEAEAQAGAEEFLSAGLLAEAEAQTEDDPLHASGARRGRDSRRSSMIMPGGGGSGTSRRGSMAMAAAASRDGSRRRRC